MWDPRPQPPCKITGYSPYFLLSPASDSCYGRCRGLGRPCPAPELTSASLLVQALWPFPKLPIPHSPAPPHRGLVWHPMHPDGRGCKDPGLASCQGMCLAGGLGQPSKAHIREQCLQGSRKWPRPCGKGSQGLRYSIALASKRAVSCPGELWGSSRVCLWPGEFAAAQEDRGE